MVSFKERSDEKRKHTLQQAKQCCAESEALRKRKHHPESEAIQNGNIRFNERSNVASTFRPHFLGVKWRKLMERKEQKAV